MKLGILHKLFLFSIAISVAVPLAWSRPVSEWNAELEDLPARDVLELVFEKKDGWPMLGNLNASDEPVAAKAKQLTATVIDALEEEAKAVSNNVNVEDLLRLAELTSTIATESRAKGGYLNDLISASAENVLILSAWHILDERPDEAEELKRRAIANMKSEIWAKSWFEKRVELDPWLMENRERLLKLKGDTGGFQAGNFLGMGRKYPDMVRPTVFEMIESPDLITLWWETFLNNFETAAVIPAAIEYCIQGGRLTPTPENKVDAVAEVFGVDGVAFSHQLRSGRIDAEDIWRSMELSLDENKRAVNLKAWFGE